MVVAVIVVKIVVIIIVTALSGCGHSGSNSNLSHRVAVDVCGKVVLYDQKKPVSFFCGHKCSVANHLNEQPIVLTLTH